MPTYGAPSAWTICGDLFPGRGLFLLRRASSCRANFIIGNALELFGTRASSSGLRRCSRITWISASAAGCVWRQEAWYLNEASAVVQRVPRPSFRRVGVGGHASGHALRAIEDAVGTGEAVLRNVRGHQPCGRG